MAPKDRAHPARDSGFRLLTIWSTSHWMEVLRKVVPLMLASRPRASLPAVRRVRSLSRTASWKDSKGKSRVSGRRKGKREEICDATDLKNLLHRPSNSTTSHRILSLPSSGRHDLSQTPSHSLHRVDKHGHLPRWVPLELARPNVSDDLREDLGLGIDVLGWEKDGEELDGRVDNSGSCWWR